MISIEERLEKAQQQKTILFEYEQELQQELKDISTQLTQKALLIRQLQKQNAETGQQLASLAIAQAHQRRKLSQKKQIIEEVLSSMTELALRSDAAAIMGSEEAHVRVQNAIILNTIEYPLRETILQTKKTIEKIAETGHQLAHIRQKQKTQQNQLTQEEQELQDLIAKKQDHRQRVSVKIRKEDAHITQLSKQAHDTKTLIEALSQLSQEQQARSEQTIIEQTIINPDVAEKRTNDKPPIPQKEQPTQKQEAFSQAMKKLILPSQGTVTPSEEGIFITAQSGAVVLAPWNGMVIYAAQFQTLGRLIIIDHGESYHSIISNLESLLVRPGQRVATGEPIGTLSKKHPPPRLHYELRSELNPINPMEWFKQPLKWSQTMKDG